MTRKELLSIFPQASETFLQNNADTPFSPVQDTKPQRHKAKPLGKTVRREEESLPRITVRFIGYRVRPLDPDNFAGSCKDLLDGLRHAQIIPGDEPWRIRFETEQTKVASFKEERTEIEITLQPLASR